MQWGMLYSQDIMQKKNLSENIYDVIGIGFGPSNLSLAVALKEERFPGNYLFLEKQPDFSWHPGMMLPDATIQTPFLKDLVTLHNPRSHFSFLNFLKEQDRLLDFIALRDFFPTRQEFNAYFKWAANQVAEHILYNRETVEIKPHVSTIKDISLVEVVVTNRLNDTTEMYLARNIVFGIGASAVMPKINMELNDQIFHAKQFMDVIKKIKDRKPHSFTVVGAGQSAAEITYYLLTHFEQSQVFVLSRGFVFHSLDENPIVNSLYSHRSSEKFYELSQSAREIFINDLTLSNFSAVDNELVRKIAYVSYGRQVQQKPPLKIYPFCEIQGVEKKVMAIKSLMKTKNTVEPIRFLQK